MPLREEAGQPQAARAVRLRLPPGGTPGAPFGGFPRSWTELGQDPRDRDRAPARGVDVKPPPGTGSGEPPRGLENPQKDEKCLKWPFLAFFAIFGLFWPK